ncbi:S-adenosyl-L-methionine-dependent methyltransferase [Thamnocephalis sphaerospora]|uniref:S-adenosyl-L-methionine-dependent methyltransferase n=1 Tax=Thamnocephalis sphaerospora TaxID=78915 RepID=A0A4P9XW55_9FUNG|nr:S-adenosyl-L-methionine-dependent methyltransferase [Thamnocephalis sphaerospora]|eukprot:RKP10543.1 S-adenosyl-L-methionine-dependent methyltransferase [Thamnocephalis sphaerospora]
MSEANQQSPNSSGSDGKRTESFSYTGGRRYHNEPNAPYPLPNDLDEVDRLDLQHYAIQQVTQKRYHAPLTSPKRAIDIGTGSGVWMMEMATDFPSCEFLGVDIAPLQPTTILPRNCRFEMANALEGLPHADGYFDYVRHSLLVTAVPKEKWQTYVNECARICASGGWVEMVETNCKTYGGGPVWNQMGKVSAVAFQARGLSPETTEHLDELMRVAGLVDVAVKEFKIPVGSWGGRVGEMFLKNLRMGNAALAPLFASVHGMTHEEVEQLMVQGEEEVKHHQIYMLFRVYVGRKP